MYVLSDVLSSVVAMNTFLSGDDGGRHENITACVCCPLELQGKFDLRVIYSAGMTGILK